MASGAGFEISSKEVLIVGGIAAALILGSGIAVSPLTSGAGKGITDITGIIPFIETQIQGFETWVGTVLYG